MGACCFLPPVLLERLVLHGDARQRALALRTLATDASLRSARLSTGGAVGPAGGGPDRFSYALTIEAGGQVHDLHCGEGGLPQAVRPLVRALVSRARSVGPTSE